MQLSHIQDAMDAHVERGVGGVAWGIVAGDETATGAAGWLDPATRARPMPADGIFRIASVSKPIAAVAALRLVDDGLLHLDQPIDPWLPELAERRVLVDAEGPVDGATVAAERPLTLRDLLAFTCGLGMRFDFSRPQPLLERLWELGVGPGPYGPDCTPDEFMARLQPLPLADQPGTTWRYHVGSDIASVLVERVRDETLDTVLRRDVLEPAGMVDTGFTIRPDHRDRVGDSRSPGDDGVMAVWDDASGRWSAPPPFRSGAAGLLSTVGDLLAFGRALLDGTIISNEMREEMCRDQFADDAAGAFDGQGWGLGIGVLRATDPAGWPGPGAVGWDGGLGSRLVIDRTAGVVATVLSTDGFSSEEAPEVLTDFNRAVGEALGAAPG